MIGLRLQELVDEIAVGGMDLHAIEAGGPRPRRRPGVVGDDLRNLGGVEGPRRLVGLFSLRRMDAVAGDCDCRRRHGQAATVKAGMRRPAHVPELKEDSSATGMDGVGGQPPAIGHGVGIDSGRLQPAVGLLGNGGRLGDDQPSRTSLGVVFGHQRIGNPRRP